VTIREWPHADHPSISSGTTGADRALERGLPSSYLDSYLDGKRGGREEREESPLETEGGYRNGS